MSFRMPRINTLLIVLCVLSLSACGAWPRSRTDAVFDDVESYINERPDSALAVLRALDSSPAVRGHARQARAALLHSIALDKCYIDLQTDSILAPAIAWYARHGSPDEKLKMLYYQGRLQYNAKDFQRAIVTYTEALELTDKATDLKYIGFVNQAIADTYSASYFRDVSTPFLERAYKAFLSVPDTTLAKLTLYKQVLSDVSQKKWERADSLHKLLLGEPKGIEAYIPRIQASYALSLLLQTSDNATQACSLFEEALSTAGSLPSANYWAAYAYCLSVTGQSNRAENIYSQLEEQYPSEKRVQFWRNKTKYKQEDYKSAYINLQEALEYQDSVLRQTLNQATFAAQKDYFAFKAAQESDRARHREQILALMLLLFVFSGILAVLLITQHKQKEQRETARLMLLVDTVQSQSEKAAQKRNQQFAHLFQVYFNTLGQICADYEEGKIGLSSIADKAMLRRIDRIVHDFVGNADGHRALEDMLDKYLDNVMTSFREDFPRMKPQDYQLASYVFSGLDMPTISVLMGLDVDVLYTRKSRLKSTISKSSSPRKTQYLSLFRQQMTVSPGSPCDICKNYFLPDSFPV